MSVYLDLQNAIKEHHFSFDIPDDSVFKLWLLAALQTINLDQDVELTIRLVDEEEARQLNCEFRDKDYATNVLSFPVDDVEEYDWSNLPDDMREEMQDDLQDDIFIGDLVICLAVVQRESEAQNKHYQDHLAHIVVHGCFHLLGMDHLNEKEAEEMECFEIKTLAKLNISNPYLID